MIRPFITATTLLIGLGLTACQSQPPVNQGTSGYRTDPTRDSPSELGSQDLRSADLINATDQAAQSMAQRLDVIDPDSPPRIVINRIENRTTMPERNYQIFLGRLRAQLQTSGSRHGLEFIVKRRRVEEAREREYGSRTPGSEASDYESRADYALACEIYDYPSGGTNYFLINFELFQLRDAATGPDVGAGASIWLDSYEVKFQ